METKINIRYREPQQKGFSSGRTAILVVGDRANIPKFSEKFNLTNNKTYNPPKLTEMSKYEFLSFLAGYIDGDGCIAKQGDYGKYKRTDVVIQVKCHGSWLKRVSEFESRLYEELDFPLTNSHVRINKQGYTFWRLSDNSVIKTFKSELVRLHLPLMERKWGKIFI